MAHSMHSKKRSHITRRGRLQPKGQRTKVPAFRDKKFQKRQLQDLRGLIESVRELLREMELRYWKLYAENTKR